MSAGRSEFPLEAVNINGPTYLKHALTSCTDPLKAIEEFQITNGILLPSLRPMLPLLDLHGVRRLDFHTSVVEVSFALINYTNSCYYVIRRYEINLYNILMKSDRRKVKNGIKN